MTVITKIMGSQKGLTDKSIDDLEKLFR
jgi:hypothetical protein